MTMPPTGDGIAQNRFAAPCEYGVGMRGGTRFTYGYPTP